MKRIIFVSISAIFLFIGMANIAQAATATSWNILPENNPYSWNGGVAANGYARDMFWNFATSPWKASGTSKPPDVVYPDVAQPFNQDSSLWSKDLITNTGSVVQGTSFKSASGDGIGIINPKTGTPSAENGTAQFQLANLTSSQPEDIWLEFDAGVSSGSITVSLDNIVGKTITSNGTTSISGTTLGTYDTWFQISSFPNNTPETIVFTFNTDSGHSNYAYIDNLRIATSPEPMAMALFATGVGVLFFFGRRRLKLQVA